MSEYDDEAAYEEDRRAQDAVDDAKYETPEQHEPPEWYYDGVPCPFPSTRGWSFTPAAQAAYPTPAGADPWAGGPRNPWAAAYSNEPPF